MHDHTEALPHESSCGPGSTIGFGLGCPHRYTLTSMGLRSEAELTRSVRIAQARRMKTRVMVARAMPVLFVWSFWCTIRISNSVIWVSEVVLHYRLVNARFSKQQREQLASHRTVQRHGLSWCERGPRTRKWALCVVNTAEADGLLFALYITRL